MRRAALDFARFAMASRGWRRMALAAAAGGLSALALAPLGWFPVLWLTVPVLVWLIDGCAAPSGVGFRSRIAPAFGVGWGFGFGYFLGGLWWIGAAFLADAGALVWLMPLAVVLLPAGLALFWGAAIAAARLVWPEGWPRLLSLAITLSLAEWLRGHVLTGFPWNSFGYVLAPSPVFLQLASVVGLWGLGFLAVLVFAAPALLWGPTARARRGDPLVFALILGLFLADIAFGAVRLSVAQQDYVKDTRIRLVQPNLAQNEKWSPGRDEEVMEKYLRLSATGMGEDGSAPFTHLVWPETAFPFFLTDRPNALAAIGALLPPGTTLLTGAARAEPGRSAGAPPLYFNSLYVIGEDGTIRETYDKVHLVPFGEYLPFESRLTGLGLREMVALPGGFDAGPRLRSLPLPDAPSFGPLICYEIIFPGAAIDDRDRPGWLVNVTNDGWFGDTPGPRQHFQQAVLRAVEEGLPLVRAANSGISAIVDPYGRIIASRGVGSAGIVEGPLPRALQPTIYSRVRDTIYFSLCLLSAVALAIASFTRTKRRN